MTPPTKPAVKKTTQKPPAKKQGGAKKASSQASTQASSRAKTQTRAKTGSSSSAKASAAPKKAAGGKGTRRQKTSGKGLYKGEIMLALKYEHRYMNRVFDAFKEQLEILDDGARPDYELMAGVILYMGRFPDKSHHPREDLIFRKLMECDEDLRSDVEAVFVQHETLALKGRTLLKNLNEMSEDASEEQLKSLRFRCVDYQEIYEKHMDFEEMKLFPLLETILTDEDWDDVSANLTVERHAVPAKRVGKQYRALNEYLTDQFEHVADEFTLIEYFGVGAFVENIGTFLTSASEIKSVVNRQAGKAYRSNSRGYSRLRQRRVKPQDFIAIPVDCFLDSFDIYNESMKEIGGILRKARRRFAEPYVSRMEIFHDMEQGDNSRTH